MNYLLLCDGDITAPEFEEYAALHCSACTKEIPKDESPQSYARLSVRLAAGPEPKIQVWCVRHNVNVGILSAVEEGYGDQDDD